MSTAQSSTPVSAQAGKAPVLLGTSPKDLRTFTNRAKLYFILKSIKDDEQKIMLVGAGLANVPELESWYLSDEEAHNAKKYDDFLKALYRRALPADFVWEMEGKIRKAKQGHQDYGDWSQTLRSDHLFLTDRIMNTREFVKCLLYGMDHELASILCRGGSLKGTGFYEDDQVAMFLGDKASTAVSTVIEYEKFDREARDEWAKIARRKEANAAQIKEATKKQQKAILAPSPSLAASRSSVPSTRPETESRSRLAKLTNLEKDWLRANKGCFHCRKLDAGHEAAECKVWPDAGHQIVIPSGWKAGDPIPSSTVKATPSSSARVTDGAIQTNNEPDIPESFEHDSDTESDV